MILMKIAQNTIISEAQREEKRVRGIRRQGHVLADVPKEGLLSLFSLSVIGALLAL